MKKLLLLIMIPVTAFAAAKIRNADIASDAAIVFSKMSALSTSKAVITDSSGVVTTSPTTAAQIGYSSDVTSMIQAQIDAKQAIVTIGNLDAQSKSTKGLTLTGNVLYGQSAAPGFPGMVSDGTQIFTGAKSFSSAIQMLANKITGLAEPTLTSDAATKNYVDTAVLTESVAKDASNYATTTVLPTVVYNNGSSGVGATLTAVALAALSIDGASPTVGQRILVKNQVSTFQNGIYTVTATGSVAAVFVLTRATDFDNAADVQSGASTFVLNGTTNGATTWVMNSPTVVTMGTDAITFAQISGPGSIIAGTGIGISGSTVSLATVSNSTIKSNISGGVAIPGDNTMTAILDSVFTSTQGSVLYRGSSSWAALTPGTSGYFLETLGASNNPTWASDNSGVTTVGTIDSRTPAANGMTISGSSIYGQSATPGFPGYVSDGVQKFTGAKTFTSNLSLEDPGAGTKKITIAVPTLASDFNFPMPSSDGVSNDVYTKTADGAKWAAPSAASTTDETIQRFTATGSTTGYVFTVTAANATVGATYTNNGNTYTVVSTITAGTTLFASNASAPAASGTLTKSAGTGDSTITFSAAVAYATYTPPSGPAPAFIRVKIVGGGGGGSGSTGCGATDGGAGTTSYFGANVLTAGPGLGGSYQGPGGAGGAVTLNSPATTIQTVAGARGGPYMWVSGGSTLMGGMGASSPFGGAGAGVSIKSGPSLVGYDATANTGSGGGGAGNNTTGAASSYSGSGGGSGGYIEALFATPTAVPYVVGTGGASGGSCGGLGATGVIIVEELY